MTERVKAGLAPVHALLAENRRLRIQVIGRPAAGEAKLAQRRADAVKWHLVDQGLAEDRIETTVGAASKVTGIELALLPPR